MKYSSEEIALCKKIAEKQRKEIARGDWIQFQGEIRLITEVVQTPEKIDIYVAMGVLVSSSVSADDDFIPLWQISDCLEFLRERAYLVFIGQEENKGWCEVNTKKIIHRHGGKTPLEALLKAVLAIVEEKS